MQTVDAATVLRAFKWRYATKQFDPARKIDAETWDALEQVLVLSPSSFGLQPWKFLVVNSPELREQLLPCSWGQKQVVDASHFVVFTVRDPLTAQDVRRHILQVAEQQSVPVEQLAGYESVVNGYIAKNPDTKNWSARQLYIALGNFMTAAALLGVDTCPMEGIDPAGYDRVLGLEGTGFYTFAACPAGYRAESDKYALLPKVRYPKDMVISHL